MVFSLHIPFFYGFYYTIFDDSEAEYGAIADEKDYYIHELHKDVKDSDFSFDWEERRKDIEEAFTDFYWEMYGSNLPFVKSVKFDYLDSPREYNFRNDELYAKFEFTDDWKDHVKSFMDENHDWLKEQIYERWSSRDGFISFVSNDVDEWYDYILENEDEVYIGEIIKYMHTIKEPFEKIAENIEMEVCEEICDLMYVIYNGE